MILTAPQRRALEIVRDNAPIHAEEFARLWQGESETSPAPLMKTLDRIGLVEYEPWGGYHLRHPGKRVLAAAEAEEE